MHFILFFRFLNAIEKMIKLRNIRNIKLCKLLKLKVMQYILASDLMCSIHLIYILPWQGLNTQSILGHQKCERNVKKIKFNLFFRGVVYAPDQSNQGYVPSPILPLIKKSLFLPLIKKSFVGGIGGRRQNKSLF